MKYEVACRDGIFEVVSHGEAEVQQFREMLDAAFAHESWRPGMPMLHDHSDLNSGPLSVDDVSRIAGFCSESRHEFGHSRVAVLVHRDLEFGLARMWDALIEGRWDAVGNVFRNRDEAVLWLMQEGPLDS